jgi:hypothetical protein
VERHSVWYGLPAVAGRVEGAATTPGYLAPSPSNAAIATMMGQQAIATMTGRRASAYYIPSTFVPPPVSRRSVLILLILSFLCIVSPIISLFLVVMTFSYSSWVASYIHSIFWTAPGLFVLIFLNLIGLLCGHLGRRQARRVFRLQVGKPKIRLAADLIAVIEVIGLLMGYLSLVILVGLLLLMYLASFINGPF